MSEDKPSATDDLHKGAAAFWSDRLDPHNIEREARAATSPQDDAYFARTPDWHAALDWLTRGGTLRGPIVDLGAGLGGNAFAMAQTGCSVIAVDTSLKRLRALRERARQLGVADRIQYVVAAAETLPFAPAALSALYTKSVMIHTDMPRAAAELARVLRPGGRAALTEPQPRNPFAMAYRRWLAPKEWQGITRYFGREEQSIFLRPFSQGRVRHFYLFSFCAFVFQFALPVKWALRSALFLLGLVDCTLFGLAPALKREAWFCVVEVEK